MTTRRAVLRALAGGLLAAPRAAEAQQAGTIYRVGLISPATPLAEMAGPEPVSPSIRADMDANVASATPTSRGMVTCLP